jgi:polar amino acid transport system substrate-binding protein
MCIPVKIHGKISAVLYLENSADETGLSEDSLRAIESITTQYVLSLEWARLYEREKELQEQNKEQLLQIMQAEKLASVGFLVAEVAHEVGNPNQAIALNADNLADMVPDIIALMDEFGIDDDFSINGFSYSRFREVYPNMIQAIRASADQINRLVTELRDFMKPRQTFEMGKVDVNKVIDSTVLIASTFIHKVTGDITRVEAELPLIKGDFQKLQQVFLNLIRNACQAVQDTRAAISILVHHDESDDTVTVTVEDDGCGIAPADLEEIEKPFFSTNQKDSGLGLGLYVCKTIIREHGRKIRFESKPGCGTRVKVTLPVAD